MNYYLQTIIIAPVTSRGREKYPTRISFKINNVSGWIVLDQLRAIDKNRLFEKIGILKKREISLVKSIIKEMLVD